MPLSSQVPNPVTSNPGVSNHRTGIHYFLTGWQLMLLPGIRRFIFLPLLINILLMASGLWWLYQHINGWMETLAGWLPSWLTWVTPMLWLLILLCLLLFFGYFFTTLANLIAAPFNGLLAEQLEAHLTGKKPPDSNIITLCADIPRILLREVQKLLYYLPRLLLLLLVTLIPGIGQLLGPLLLFLFAGWMMAIQYSDYPFDNHKVPFKAMKQLLSEQRFIQLQFGCTIALCNMIPLLNMLVMPAAVCAATAMWVEKYANRCQ